MNEKTIGVAIAAVGLYLLLTTKEASAGEVDTDRETGPGTDPPDGGDVPGSDPAPATPNPKLPPGGLTPFTPDTGPDEWIDPAVKRWIDLFPIIVPDNRTEPTTWAEVEALIAEDPTQGKFYRVRTGDSLSLISQRAGLGGTTWRAINNHPWNAWALDNKFVDPSSPQIKLYRRYDAPGWNVPMRAKTQSWHMWPVLYIPKQSEV